MQFIQSQRVRPGEGLLHGVKGTGSDIAEHDTDSAKEQSTQGCLSMIGRRGWMRRNTGHVSSVSHGACWDSVVWMPSDGRGSFQVTAKLNGKYDHRRSSLLSESRGS